MTPEFIAIIAVGVSLAGLMLRLNRRIDCLEDRFEDRLVLTEQRWRDDLKAGEKAAIERHERLEQRLEQRLEDRLAAFEQRFEDRLVAVEQGLAELRERMARVEGLLEGLRDAVVRAAA